MSDRIDKVNQALRKEIGTIVQFELKDPRLEFVTITYVEVTRDLQHARVYFSVLGDAKRIHTAQQGLESARGFIRRIVGQRIQMRYTPEIEFSFDETMARGLRIEGTLDDIKTKERDQDTHPA